MSKPPKLPASIIGNIKVTAQGSVINRKRIDYKPAELSCPPPMMHIIGPPYVYEVPLSVTGINMTIDAQSEIYSDAVESFYLPHICCAVTSTQDGVLSIERYVDKKGLILQGMAITSRLTTNESTVIDYDDGKAFGSFRIKITNTTSAPALLSGIFILLLAG